MAKRWKPQEITYLKRYAKVRLLKELAERFKTTPEEVLKQLKIQQLGTKDGHGYIERPPDPMVAISWLVVRYAYLSELVISLQINVFIPADNRPSALDI